MTRPLGETLATIWLYLVGAAVIGGLGWIGYETWKEGVAMGLRTQFIVSGILYVAFWAATVAAIWRVTR